MKTPTVSINRLKALRDDYERGIQALQEKERAQISEIEKTRLNIVATAGSAEALKKLIEEIEAKKEKP